MDAAAAGYVEVGVEMPSVFKPERDTNDLYESVDRLYWAFLDPGIGAPCLEREPT